MEDSSVSPTPPQYVSGKNHLLLVNGIVFIEKEDLTLTIEYENDDLTLDLKFTEQAECDQLFTNLSRALVGPP